MLKCILNMHFMYDKLYSAADGRLLCHVKINANKCVLLVPRSMCNTRRVHYRAVSQLIATTFPSLIEAYYETFLIDTLRTLCISAYNSMSASAIHPI